MDLCIDNRRGIVHSKIMVVDNRVVITGSFNFTVAPEETNREDLLVIRDEAPTALYEKNWQERRAQSVPYE